MFKATAKTMIGLVCIALLGVTAVAATGCQTTGSAATAPIHTMGVNGKNHQMLPFDSANK